MREGMALTFRSVDERSTRFATGVWLTLFRVDRQLWINTMRNHAVLFRPAKQCSSPP